MTPAILDLGVQRRFWGHVEVHTDSCWSWDAAHNKAGYGVFNIERGHQIGAHRFAYLTLIGEIPAGMVLDHLCRVPGCVNPYHLDAVTQRENVLRGQSPASWYPIRNKCFHGHRFNTRNTYIRPNGARACRQCRRDAMRRLRRRRAATGVRRVP